MPPTLQNVIIHFFTILSGLCRIFCEIENHDRKLLIKRQTDGQNKQLTGLSIPQLFLFYFQTISTSNPCLLPLLLFIVAFSRVADLLKVFCGKCERYCKLPVQFIEIVNSARIIPIIDVRHFQKDHQIPQVLNQVLILIIHINHMLTPNPAFRTMYNFQLYNCIITKIV